jgi:nitrogen fixation protein FixH
MTRTFTGWHMSGILVSFFAVVITVNLVMARYATGTFGGVVVENSYVASQNYNHWLDAAERQAQLGWVHSVTLDRQRRLVVRATKNGVVLPALSARGLAVHPLGRAKPLALNFERGGDGNLHSREALPAGRWHVRIGLHSADVVFKIDEAVS